MDLFQWWLSSQGHLRYDTAATGFSLFSEKPEEYYTCIHFHKL
jgi:hypothetical protein